MRWILLVTVLIQTFHIASVLYLLYATWTNTQRLESVYVIYWPYAFVPLDAAVTALFLHGVQAFRLSRILRLTAEFWASKLITPILVITAMAACALGITVSACGWKLADRSMFDSIRSIVAAWLILQVLADGIAAGTIIYLIYSGVTSYREHAHTLDGPIRRIFRIGFFAIVFSLGALISFWFASTTTIYSIFEIPIGNIYLSTLIASFPSRDGSPQENFTNVFENDLFVESSPNTSNSTPSVRSSPSAAQQARKFLGPFQTSVFSDPSGIVNSTNPNSNQTVT
ncbi:hypothetical protein HGRIS_001357 [Hohenbuehelia grisea]|uniref:Transmembrane protein n=1 Tax=Hohenbuehelia grisea TaxID=104357 RepID=A0ABR3JQG0_9AGAR